MYKLYILLFLLVSLFVYSQEEDNDTTFFKFGSTKFIIINDDDTSKIKEVEFRGHFVGFSFGINSLNIQANNFGEGKVNNNVLQLEELRSWEVNLDFYQHSINLYKEHFGIVTGLGFKFNNYRFKNKYRIINATDSVYAVMDTVNNFYKSKLSISKIRVPLIFEWQNRIGRKHRLIYFSAGVYGSYNILAYTKYNYKRDGQKVKEKYYDTYQLNPLQYGAIVKFAYGAFEIYAEYNLSEMFINEKAAPVNQFSVGLVLLDF